MKQPANRPLVMLAGCKHFWGFSQGALANFSDHMVTSVAPIPMASMLENQHTYM